MSSIMNQQQLPEELFTFQGKTQLEMAELLLNQNTLGLQIMLSNKMNSAEPFPELALKFLEDSIRCNHFLSYNLIMSHISQLGMAEMHPFNQIQPINEENKEEQQEEEQQRREEQKVEVSAEPTEVQNELQQENYLEEDFILDIFEDYGLSKNQINKLPQFKYTELFNDEPTIPNLMAKSKKIQKNRKNLSSTSDTCCICLSQYRANSKLRKLPCGHYFHLKCIDRWLKKNSKCPFCRKAMEGL